MKVLMSGATGLIGQELGLKLVQMGHQVVALTRNPEKVKLKYPAKIFKWDASGSILSSEQMKDIDVVIHLAGEGIADRRWSDERKRQILNSRAQGTQNLVSSVLTHGTHVKLFISASGVSFYGCSKIESPAFTEETPKGHGFLADVCEQWEKPIAQLSPTVRNVIFRIAPVFTKTGGFLDQMVPIFKKGLGGRLGSGEQWMPWIHIEDLTTMMIAAIADPSMSGVYNATAGSIQNKNFTKILCRVLGVFQFLPVPTFALKALYGEMSDLLLCSQKVESRRWTKFQHQDIEKALKISLE